MVEAEKNKATLTQLCCTFDKSNTLKGTIDFMVPNILLSFISVPNDMYDTFQT